MGARMEFLAFLFRRLLWSVLVLFGLSVLIFLIARVVPGDPARMALGPTATQEQVADLQEALGLNRPMVEQYGLFLAGLAQGELGRSLLTERSVNDDIREAFPATLELVLVTVLIALVVGVPLGVAAARWKDRWPDHIVRGIAIFAAVMPTFFIALLLQVLAGYVLQILPTTGRLPTGMDFEESITGLLLVDSVLKGRPDVFFEAARHLLLPALALSLATTGQIARITRASMIDVSRQDYIEAARAFGVPDRVRLFKYQLRPAFVPPLTILGLEFASLIGGAFVVELIFSWPGMAAYGIRAITQKDLNAIMGVVMVSGVFFVLVNLLIDVAVGIVDPRIRIRGGRA
jgi:peptide/nickel transport system permease protein